MCDSEAKEEGLQAVSGHLWHTPLSTKEDIPWGCRRLVVGTGAEGGLPVMAEVRKEAQLRKVELLSLPTKAAIAILDGGRKDTNAILHVTC